MLVAEFLLVGYLAVVLSVPTSVVAQKELENVDAVLSGIRANAVEGELTCKRRDESFKLEAGVELKEDDQLSSGVASRAEVLLQPGNYLRIGDDTAWRLLGDQYDRLKLQLEKGSLVLELLKNDWERSPAFLESPDQGYELIRIVTKDSEVLISEPGIFRVNVAPDGHTEVLTRRGELVLNGQRVKEKRSASTIDGTVVIKENDVKAEDGFDTWCRERADKLIQANRSLKKDAPWVKARKLGNDAIVDLPPLNENRSSPYVVSAKPGTVNFVEAGVEFNQPTEATWRNLSLKSDLAPGAKVRTAPFCYAELTMLPDVYLRIGSDSELVLEQLSHDVISIRVLRGAVILDVPPLDKELPLMRLGGKTLSAEVRQKGNYRVDVRQGGDEITVREGKIEVGGRYISGCRIVRSGSTSECDKKRRDNFDFWSVHRGEGEFYGRTMASFLNRMRRQRFRNTGFWYQLETLGYFTFVPFSSSSFQSPYGGNYSSVFNERRPFMF
jgi:hypothetical protein